MALVTADGRWPTPPTEVQQFFLERLGRMMALRVASTVDFDAAILLHAATYSTYRIRQEGIANVCRRFTVAEGS